MSFFQALLFKFHRCIKTESDPSDRISRASLQLNKESAFTLTGLSNHTFGLDDSAQKLRTQHVDFINLVQSIGKDAFKSQFK